MSRNLIVTIVVIAVIIFAGWWFLTKSQQSVTSTPAPDTMTTPVPTQSPSSATEGAMMEEDAMMKAGESKVVISAKGFSPQNITIKAGDSITWTNEDSADHTVNSAPHPTHTDYAPLNLGVIKAGESKSLTFPKAGTYKYHDHLNPSLFGTITVQ